MVLTIYEEFKYIGTININFECNLCKKDLKDSNKFYIYEAKEKGIEKYKTIFVCKECYRLNLELQEITKAK